MTYTVIYVNAAGERKWKQKSDFESAEQFGKDHSDNDYAICVSLYEYNFLKKKIKIMEDTFKQIEKMAQTSRR